MPESLRNKPKELYAVSDIKFHKQRSGSFYMSHGLACIDIFNRASARDDKFGAFVRSLHNYVYTAALQEDQRVHSGMEIDFPNMERMQHERVDFTHPETRKAVLNGRTAEFETVLQAAGQPPETLAAIVAQFRGAANDHLRAHVSDGHIHDNDADLRRNTADAALVRVAPILGLNN